MKVIRGAAAEARPSPLEDAYADFRLDRQVLPVSPGRCSSMTRRSAFLDWLRLQHARPNWRPA